MDPIMRYPRHAGLVEEIRVSAGYLQSLVMLITGRVENTG